MVLRAVAVPEQQLVLEVAAVVGLGEGNKLACGEDGAGVVTD